MLGLLLNKIGETYPYLECWLLIVFIAMVLSYKFALFYKDTKEKNKKVDNIDKLLKQIDTGLGKLNAVLLEKEYIKASCYSQCNSPRIINSLGDEVLIKSKANILFETIKDEFLTDLKNKEFDSLLELERESFNVFLDKMNDKRFKGIQNFAYRNPNFNGNPLGYIDILFLMALKLRDYYLEKNENSGLD